MNRTLFCSEKCNWSKDVCEHLQRIFQQNQICRCATVNHLSHTFLHTSCHTDERVMQHIQSSDSKISKRVSNATSS